MAGVVAVAVGLVVRSAIAVPEISVAAHVAVIVADGVGEAVSLLVAVVDELLRGLDVGASVSLAV